MRKSFTTAIDEELQKKFKIACIQNDVKMNDVLEEFMRQFISGESKIGLSGKK